MNSIQSDVSFSKGMIGFFFCYKVSIFVALLFNLKGGLYEDASVVFFLTHQEGFCVQRQCLHSPRNCFVCFFFFLFSCYGFRLDQFPGLNHCINTRVDARAGRSAAVSTSGWRQGVRMWDRVGRENKAHLTPGHLSEDLPIPPEELPAVG